MNELKDGDLDRLAGELREHFSAPAPDAEASQQAVVRHGQWWAQQRMRVRWARRIVVAGLAGYLALYYLLSARFHYFLQQLENRGELSAMERTGVEAELVYGVTVPLLIATLGLWLIHRRGFGSQLAARSVFWGLSLVVAWTQTVLLRTLGTGMEQAVGTLPLSSAIALVATLCCVGVLLVLGDHGLQSPRQTRFRPVAFGGILTLSLVMGIADALLLAFFGASHAAFVGWGLPLVGLGLALWLGVSAWGLVRLRVWGLAAMALGNVFEVFAFAAGAFDRFGELVFILLATATVQLVLPVPVYAAMLRGKPSSPERSSYLRHIPTAVLVAMTVFALVQFAITLGST